MSHASRAARRWAIRVAAIVAATGLLAACDAAIDAPITNADRFEAIRSNDPRFPLAVPVELPEGYGRLRGPISQTAAGEVTDVSWLYGPPPGGDAPWVTLCTTRHPNRGLCPAPDGVVVSETDLAGWRVALVADASDADVAAQLWEITRFTMAWRDVRWLYEPE